MQLEDGLQLSDILSILRRRLPLIGAIAGAVFLIAIVIAAVLPNRYDAWTTLLVEPQTISERLIEAGVAESDLNSRLHLMTMQILSRSRLSRIIDEFELYPEESEEMTRQDVISLMRSHVRVEPVLPELVADGPRNQDIEINTFRIFFRSDDSRTAANVANRLANNFIEEHIRDRVQVSSDTSEFIEAELQRLAEQIRQVEGRIAAVKNENVGSLPEDFAANQSLLERTLADLRYAQRDLSIAESDEAFYRQQALSGAGDGVAGYGRADSPADRLQRLELALGEYRSRGLTDKHPDVIAAQEEIEIVRAGIDEESDDEGDKVQNIATNESERAAIRAAAARQDLARLNDLVTDLEQRLGRTPAVAEQLTALEREHEHLAASYQDYSQKRLEAAVQANMERRQKGEQFRILETAFEPTDPASPNRILILLIGLFLGIAVGGGVAIVLEALDDTVRGAREAQGSLGVPVLASIPAVRLQSDIAAERRRRFFAAALAAGIAGVTLFGAGVGYVAVNGAPGFVSALTGDAEGDAPAPAPAPAPAEGEE